MRVVKAESRSTMHISRYHSLLKNKVLHSHLHIFLKRLPELLYYLCN